MADFLKENNSISQINNQNNNRSYSYSFSVSKALAGMDHKKKNKERSEKSPIRANTTQNYRERDSETSNKTSLKSQSPSHSIHSNDSNSRSTASINRQERGRPLERKTLIIKDSETISNGNDNNDNNNDSQQDMFALMGFGSFETTKNKHVAGVGKGSVKKNKKSEFRQYMNREKGFNRALSPERKK